MLRHPTSPTGAGSKICLEVMPIDSVTLSDGRRTYWSACGQLDADSAGACPAEASSRRAPDRPSPRPSPVLQPSVRARLTSAISGPSPVKPIVTLLRPLAIHVSAGEAVDVHVTAGHEGVTCGVDVLGDGSDGGPGE